MPTRAELTLRFLAQQYPVREDVVSEVVRAGQTAAIRALMASMGTPDADILDYARKLRERQTELGRAIIKALPDNRPDASLQPISFALVGTESPNAVAIHDRSDGSFAIALDPGPLNLFNGVFLAAVYALRSGELPVLAWTLHDFVHAIYLNRVVPGFEECQLRLFKALPNFRSVYRGVGDIVLRFIIAHELGHINLRHFAQESAPRLKLLPDLAREEEISAFDHEREYAADEWAVKTMLTSLPPTATVMEAVGIRLLPAVFFAIVALAQELHEPATPIGRQVTASHPSPWNRGARVRQLQPVPEMILHDPIFAILHRLPDFLQTHRVSLLELARNHPADRQRV